MDPVPFPNPAAPRRHVHTRSTVFNGFLRDDGLWDIEAEIRDTKPFEAVTADFTPVPAGHPFHNMRVRLTIDDDFLVREVWSDMPFTPFPECQGTQPALGQLVGARLAGGWRKTLDQVMGKERGCTHVRELLFNMASAAYQTVGGWKQVQMRMSGQFDRSSQTVPQPHLGQCMGWAFDGPVVARIWPQFVGWKPVKRVDKVD